MAKKCVGGEAKYACSHRIARNAFPSTNFYSFFLGKKFNGDNLETTTKKNPLDYHQVELCVIIDKAFKVEEGNEKLFIHARTENFTPESGSTLAQHSRHDLMSRRTWNGNSSENLKIF